MSENEWFSIDRILGDVAVLEDAAGNSRNVPLTELPEDIAEGTRLRLTESGYVADAQETASRRRRVLDLQDRLRKKNCT